MIPDAGRGPARIAAADTLPLVGCLMEDAMPYLIETLTPEQASLPDALCALCEAREAAGWALVTMASHPVALPQPAGMAQAAYVTEWVLVFMQD